MIERRFLPTERLNPNTRDIDLRTTLQIVRTMNREDRRVAPAVGRCAGLLARAVDLIVTSLRSGGRLLFVGAGTSGRLGVMEAAECPPTFGTPSSLVRAVMAGGRSAVFRSREGAEDDPHDGAGRMRRWVRRGDVVVGISASGVTPFVRGALRQARRSGCRTILITSNQRAASGEAEIVVSPNLGPEVIAGSTRLKSGSAAKLMLNTLTTASMIRLGKVYDRWMVDMKPISGKLRARGARIVGELGRVDPPKARALLRSADGNVKAAVVAARLHGAGSADIRLQRARRLLAEADGNLRVVLKGLDGTGR